MVPHAKGSIILLLVNDANFSLLDEYRQLKALYESSQIIHSTLEPKEALQLLLREAMRHLQGQSGSVVLINPNTGFLEIEACEGLPENAAALKLRVGEGVTGWVAKTGVSLRVGETKSDSRYISFRENVRSELAVPLRVNGEVRGVLNIDSDRPDAFTEKEQELLEALALQASKVIQNTWLFEQLRLKAQLFETLARIGQTITSTLSLSDTLFVITREASLLMGAKMCSLLMLDETGQWLDLKASFGAGEAYIRKPRLNLGESLTGIVVRRKKPLQVENVQVSSIYQSVEIARHEGLISLLSVPLVFNQQSIGALNVYTGEVHQFSNEEIRILSAFSDLSAIALEKARLYERIVKVEEQLRLNEKLSALGLLAAEVAHEIRNPLTVMKMLYHSLDLKFAPEDPRARDSEIIVEKIEHLNRIVEQILDFARRSEPTLQPVDLNTLLEDLTLLVRHKIHHQGIELVLQLDRNLRRIRGDEAQLEQAFLNLILNSMEAMPEGGKLLISTTDDPAAGRLLVSIQDAGSGLSPEQCRDAFSSLLSTTKEGGTGLGLAIVGRILEAHGAQPKITSVPGKGTRVDIRFSVVEN